MIYLLFIIFCFQFGDRSLFNLHQLIGQYKKLIKNYWWRK